MGRVHEELISTTEGNERDTESNELEELVSSYRQVGVFEDVEANDKTHATFATRFAATTLHYAVAFSSSEWTDNDWKNQSISATAGVAA